MTQDYKKLIIWKKAHELTLEIYKISKKLPDDEKFGLVSQLRRAVTSIELNIVEGTTGSNKMFQKFLITAKGSSKETECILHICKDLGYISPDIFLRLTKDIQILQASIQNLINRINLPNPPNTKPSKP
jgi:four helix bundle protein